MHRARLLQAGQAEDRLGRPGREGGAGLGAGERRERAGGGAAGAELDEPAASAVALLALVAGQDVEPAEGSDGRDGRWRIARKVAEDRVISTVDPQARHTRKSPEARRDGYRAHLAADPDTGIITDEKLTGAAGTENSDAAVAAEFVAAEAAAGGRGGDRDQDDASGQLAWYGDSAYGTGDLRAAIAAAGHQAVIKPWPLLPAVEGGFTADDFTVDAAAGTVTCPAGITRHVTARNAVIFGAACRDCPLREQCTTAKDGRTLHLHEHDGLLRAARADWAAGPGCARTTWPTGPTSSAPSPRSPPGGDAGSSSATAERPGTTPGSSAAPPR